MQVIFIIIVTFCGLSAALQDAEVKQEWLEFKQKFNKKYTRSLEEQTRFIKFKRNLVTIYEHNQKFEKGESSYEMGINQYTDMDAKDMEYFLMDAKITERNHEQYFNATLYKEDSLLSKANIPETFDWREKGAITPVKDQKSCGSCWAFSSTGALEAHNFIKNNVKVELSEQNLVDCVTENWGCSGGWMHTSFEYVAKNGGINTDISYPYESKDGNCRFNPQHIGGTCSRYTRIRRGDEQALLHAVATRGPVSVAFYTLSSFFSYKSGVYNEPNCVTNVLHAVLITGFGTENGQDYWTVKNSWSDSWGNQGYAKMSRNKSNQCGIATWASFPEV